MLSGTLETKIVKTRPEGMPVTVDWPEEIEDGVAEKELITGVLGIR